MGSSVNTITSFGNRNRIINGDMRFDQRNVGNTISPTNSQYAIDRWRADLTQASKFNTTRLATSPPAGFTHYLRLFSNSPYTVTSTDYFGVNQLIEATNLLDFQLGTANAKAFSLSFWARSSLTGTFSGAIRTGDSSNYSYPFTYSLPVANTWTQISISIPGPTAGTWATGAVQGMDVWFSLGTGSNLSGTAGAWTAANILGVTGAVSLVGTTSATLDLTGVQLELGPTNTPFERRPYGHELYLCQRYFEKSYETETALATNTALGTWSSCAINSSDFYTYGYVPFKVPKRSTPTIQEYSQLGNAGVLYNASSSVNQGNAGTNNASQNGFHVFCNNASMTTNAAFTLHWYADAEL